MARRSKPTKTAPATAGAPVAIERTIPLYRIGRWQGGYAVWRSDGTLLGWHLERADAESQLQQVGKNSSKFPS